MDWKALANQLNLNKEVPAIDVACQQQENPLLCKLRELVERFINSQGLEPCHTTVEKIASALEALTQIKRADELRDVCISTGMLF